MFPSASPPPAPRPGPPAAERSWLGLPGAVWLFGFASFFNDASSEAVFPLLGLFLSNMGAPMQSVGLVLGMADTLAVGIKIAAGRWSDRARRRPLVIAGYLVAAAGKAAIALSGSPWQVLAARTLDRAGKGLRSGPRDAMLTDAIAATQRGRAFGLQKSMDHLGAAFGPLVASACLAGGLSLRGTFGVAAAVGLTPTLLLWWRLREGERPAPARAPLLAEVRLQPGTPTSGGVRAGEARQPGRPLTAYLVVCGMFALANSSDAFILVRARDLGWTPAAIPLLWLGHHAIKSVTAAVGGSLSDRWPRVWMIAGGWLAYAAAYAGFAGAQQRWHIMALLMFYAVYHGLAEGPERAVISDLAGATSRGRAFGLYHGVVGLAALPASLLTGWLWDRAGAAAAFGACALLAFSAATALLLLVRFGPLRAQSRPIVDQTPAAAS